MLLFSWMTLVGVVRAEFLRARNFDHVRAARAQRRPAHHLATRAADAMVAALTFLPFVWRRGGDPDRARLPRLRAAARVAVAGRAAQRGKDNLRARGSASPVS
jgi:microcin C transport system permease protein